LQIDVRRLAGTARNTAELHLAQCRSTAPLFVIRTPLYPIDRVNIVDVPISIPNHHLRQMTDHPRKWPEPARRARRSGGFVYPSYLRVFIAGLFFMAMCLSVFLVRLTIGGFPMRTLFVMALLGTVLLIAPWLVLRALRSQIFIVILVLYAAFCGLMASILAGNELPAVLGQLVEIHVQAIAGLVLGYCIIEICGARTFAIVFTLPIAVSLLFAFLQFAGSSGAWAIYDRLASMQPQSTADLIYYDIHTRPLGLSYSPVHLGTQMCLGFALLFGYRIAVGGPRAASGNELWLPVLVVTVAIGALASGNRSPLLGVIIFVGAFLYRARPGLALAVFAMAPAVVILGDIVIELLNSSGLRALNTENSSGEGRAALRAYGMLLFLDRPFGYGLLFDSLDYWWKYWSYIQDYDNANAITQHALHNSFLMSLNKHGILILLVAPLLVRAFYRNSIGTLAFIPYIVHIFYHNDGPLQGDFFFWYVLPFFSAMQKPLWLAARRRRGLRPSLAALKPRQSSHPIQCG
jgi:hypothetical protein